MGSEIEGAFGQDGFSATSSAETVTSIDIKDSLDVGVNVIVLANFTDNPTTEANAFTMTGLIRAYADVVGYLKMEGDD